MSVTRRQVSKELTQCDADAHTRVEEMFRRHDGTGQGTLKKSFFHSVLAQCGCGMEKNITELLDRFQKIDANGAAQPDSDTVNYKKFFNWLWEGSDEAPNAEASREVVSGPSTSADAQQAPCVYDAKTEWSNALFLDFADCELVREMAKWRKTHGFSDFPAHATLLVVDEVRFPPDDPSTPANVAAAVREVLQELSADVQRGLPMHVDGLIKFGDYTPHVMRMLQVEAVGNFVGQGFTDCKAVDGGDGLRKLLPPCEDAEYAERAPSPDVSGAYGRLQVLRERLCMRLGPEAARAACADHSKWKPHVSAAYVNEGCDGMTEAMALAWRGGMLRKGVLPATLQASAVSYWDMRGKICSEWVELSRVTLPGMEVRLLPAAVPRPLCVYDAKTAWSNSLFLDFAGCGLVREMAAWRGAHGFSEFPAHATLLVVDEARFPPDDATTPARVAEAVAEVLADLAGEVRQGLSMHVDGLIKFGDYKPHAMRMLQVEAVGNFVGQGFTECKAVDGGDGLRKLHPPCEDAEYSGRAQSADIQNEYAKLQVLREKLCMKLGSDAAKRACTDHTKWKPHVSAAYVNEGCDGMTEGMALAWQRDMLQKKILPTELRASAISYWDMRGKICSKWIEQSRVTLPDMKISIIP